jgi:restriction system protein
MEEAMPVPKYDEMYNPTLSAMKALGGSASNQELEDRVGKLLKLSDKDLSSMQEGHNRTQFTYRLAWARTWLRLSGYLENTERGVWALTKAGMKAGVLKKDEIYKKVHAQIKKMESERIEKKKVGSGPDESDWRERLVQIIRKLPPDAFERLCQRFLREAGFIEVEVTGKSGDGGIDGHGVVKIGGLLSFHLHFQAKRYKGSVPSSAIRDFRGAMAGRADKGLMITTGIFTRDARAEAQRPGTIPIDLIDGSDLAERMKELRMGIFVKEERIEKVEVLADWFKDI